MHKLRVDIPGLDLVLGGGIPAVRRAEDLPESATLLVRGPPGSGKSVLGTQIAGALGRELGADVAYGCLELLPLELRAQHEAFGRTGERVVVPPFGKHEAPSKGNTRIFAAVLDVGPAGAEQSNFGAAILELLDVVGECGGVPRVLVIDSLSDGYNLGASAPRELVDRLCKLAAARGLFLVLLEETTDGKPSSWSFAADVVLELEAHVEDQPPDMPAPFERRITVVKNRFAPSDVGPHRFTISSSSWPAGFPPGFVVFPRPSAYLTPWASELVLPVAPKAPTALQAWGLRLEPAPELPFRSSVTAVYGSDAALVFDLVRKLGVQVSGGDECPGTDVVIDFGRPPGSMTKPQRNQMILEGGNPFLSGNRFIAATLRVLEKMARQNVPVRRVLIGDFRAIRTFWNPDGIRRAVAVLSGILRRAGIPAVLFETIAGLRITEHPVISVGGRIELLLGPEFQEPSIVDIADATIAIATTPSGAYALMTDVRGGRTYHWQVKPPD